MTPDQSRLTLRASFVIVTKPCPAIRFCCPRRCPQDAPAAVVPHMTAQPIVLLVPGEGFEPPTFGLQNRCTTTVLTRRNLLRFIGYFLLIAKRKLVTLPTLLPSHLRQAWKRCL